MQLLFALLLVGNFALVEEDKERHRVFNKYMDCGESSQSILLAKMLIESGEQQRKKRTCNQTLSLVALHKAKVMAKEGRVAHNINNTTPNQLLRRAGIPLPFIYEVTGNQIEAVSGGKKNSTGNI